MLTLEEARQRIFAALPAPQAETIPLDKACGRVALEHVTAQIPLPPFDNSAMDGYALRAADVAQATFENETPLRVVGEAAAGNVFDGEVMTGTCVRVFTGSPLPRDADAVVMQEDTRRDEAKPDQVLVLDRVRPWENVRLCGEDVKAGASLLQPHTLVSASQIGLLASTGVASLKVSRQPVIGLLATGSELREPGQQLSQGQIYESNRLTLAALISQAGAVPCVFPLVPDDLARTREAIEMALNECDAVVTSGGASVGDHDYVKQAFTETGGTLDFWKVAIKPGKPFLFGLAKGKPVFGVPGNPVSAFVTFLVLVRPALLRMLGNDAPPFRGWLGELAEPLANRGDRRHFMRVRRDAQGGVWPAGLQASHALGSLAAANGLVDVPPETVLPTGARVSVLTWD